jgi:tripartite-type tricarboxylate transporter receptor subunit TctC
LHHETDTKSLGQPPGEEEEDQRAVMVFNGVLLQETRERRRQTMKKREESKEFIWLFCIFAMFFFIHAPKTGQTQEKYPTKTIKFIVPMNAGGGTDITCRKVAEVVGKALGEAIIIENRAGGGGLVGATSLAKSKPDGYTIGAAISSTFCLTPFFSKMDFDPLTDLVPIMQMMTMEHFLLVRADSPMKTFEDFVKEGRKRQISVGVNGMMIGDLALDRLAALGKLNIKQVPYGGSAKVGPPLLSGEVEAVEIAGLRQYVRSGQMRILARLTDVPAEKLAGELKGTPHVKDFGYDVEAPGFVGVFVPKGLPGNIQMKLEEEFTRAALNPSIIETFNSFEIATYRNGKEFGNFIRQMREQMQKTIKDLGLGIFAKDKK